MNKKEILKENLAKRICGEIVLSERPGEVIKKWRNIFKVSQKEVANEIGVMPSVISDYESGRRKSPGIKIIRKIVDALIRISERKGEIIKEFYTLPGNDFMENIIEVKEFEVPVSIKKFCEDIGAVVITREDLVKKDIYGYTLIDSIKAIVELSPMDLVKAYGMTTDRALIFTNVSSGRSPMVAIKVTNLKPSLVVFQGPEKVDEIAQRIAEIEGIVLATTNKNINELKSNLKRVFG